LQISYIRCDNSKSTTFPFGPLSLDVAHLLINQFAFKSFFFGDSIQSYLNLSLPVLVENHKKKNLNSQLTSMEDLEPVISHNYIFAKITQKHRCFPSPPSFGRVLFGTAAGYGN
jgi:hypothetical protein